MCVLLTELKENSTIPLVYRTHSRLEAGDQKSTARRPSGAPRLFARPERRGASRNFWSPALCRKAAGMMVNRALSRGFRFARAMPGASVTAANLLNG
jgi:hypothetical protein